MENLQSLKTIFQDAQVITTDPTTVVGKTLLKPITKSWVEDFVDEDSGEVISINRSEVLLDAGTRITPDIISQIQFFKAEGSCGSVVVSDQCRGGVFLNNNCRRLYLYTLTNGETKITLYLAAADDIMAVQIGHDFAELVCNGYCWFDTLKRTNLVYVPLPEYATEEDADGEPIVRQFFQVVVSVKFASIPKPTQARYLTYAKNADEASETIRVFRNDIRKKVQKKEEDTIENEKILKVSPIEVSYIVPEQFFADYKEAEKSGRCVHNHEILSFKV